MCNTFKRILKNYTGARHLVALLIAVLFATLGANAEFVVVGKISYGVNSTTQTAYVDGSDDDIITANIQSSITYNGRDYPVTSIASNAFSWCTTLTTVNIPISVTKINSNAFSGCTSLRSIYIHSQVTAIGTQAFNGCTGLTSVSIGSACTSIGDYAFQNCAALTTIVIGAAVASMGKYVFAGCKSLTSLTLPASLTTIGAYALKNCTALKSLTIADGNNNLTVGTGWLSGTPLQKVTYGRATVAEKLFYNVSTLNEVTLTAAVKTVSTQAFDMCPELASFTCNGTTAPTAMHSVDQQQFTDGVFTTATLYVPTAAVSTYRAAHCWGTFVNIAEIGSAGVDDIICDNNDDTHKNIYNLHGVLIQGAADKETIDNLPRGIYIIGKSKVLKQ